MKKTAKTIQKLVVALPTHQIDKTIKKRKLTIDARADIIDKVHKMVTTMFRKHSSKWASYLPNRTHFPDKYYALVTKMIQEKFKMYYSNDGWFSFDGETMDDDNLKLLEDSITDIYKQWDHELENEREWSTTERLTVCRYCKTKTEERIIQLQTFLKSYENMPKQSDYPTHNFYSDSDSDSYSDSE